MRAYGMANAFERITAVDVQCASVAPARYSKDATLPQIGPYSR